MQTLSNTASSPSAPLTSGFTAAVQPIASSLITTDTTDLLTGTIDLPVKEETIPAYYAQPSIGDRFPIILVIQEIFGVHAHIQDVCRRLAKLGYLAIAPELFIRQGDVSQLTTIEDVRQIAAQVPDAQVLADLDAAVAWAVQTAKGDADRLAITGFCWGGRITWLYSAHNPKVKAGIAWYGRLVGDSSDRQPIHPIAIAEQLTVPVLGLYGGQDAGIPLATVEQMRDQLKTGSSRSEIIVYPEAPHAFFADYRPSYREADAKDAWQRLQTWLKQHGI